MTRELEIELVRDSLQRGRTFSADALNEISRQVAHFIAGQMLEAWDAHEVPPTRAVVRVELQ